MTPIRQDFLVEVDVYTNQDSQQWEVVRIVGTREDSKDYARRVWLGFPEKRTNVRVRRVGSSFPSDVYKGGMFRRNFGKWQRIPPRRFGIQLLSYRAKTSCALTRIS